MIVVRQSVKQKPKAIGKTLFLDLEELSEYRYQCYATNLDLPKTAIWQLYRGGADFYPFLIFITIFLNYPKH